MFNCDIKNWSILECSSDASVIVAATKGGFIYRTTNGGSTWTQLTNAGSKQWSNISMSSNGSTIVASSTDYSPYVSTNGGSSWTILSGMSANSSVSISPNGLLLAILSNSIIHISINYGISFPFTITVPPNTNEIKILDNGKIITNSGIVNNYTQNSFIALSIGNFISCSNDGNIIVADNRISKNGGITFTNLNGRRASVDAAGLLLVGLGPALEARTIKPLIAPMKGSVSANSLNLNITLPAGVNIYENLLQLKISPDGTKVIMYNITPGLIFYISSVTGWTYRPNPSLYSNNEVYSSNFDTISWSLINTETTQYSNFDNWNTINCSYNGSSIVVGSKFGSLSKSTDYGSSWSKIWTDSPERWHQAKISNGGSIIVASCMRRLSSSRTDYVIYRSADGGSSWSKIYTLASIATDRIPSFDMSDDGSLIVLMIYSQITDPITTSTSILISINGQEFIQTFPGNFASPTSGYRSIPIHKIKVSNDGNLVIAGLVWFPGLDPLNRSVNYLRILYSDTRGINWKLSPTLLNLTTNDTQLPSWKRSADSTGIPSEFYISTNMNIMTITMDPYGIYKEYYGTSGSFRSRSTKYIINTINNTILNTNNPYLNTPASDLSEIVSVDGRYLTPIPQILSPSQNTIVRESQIANNTIVRSYPFNNNSIYIADNNGYIQTNNSTCP